MQILPLAAAPFAIPILARWLHAEWGYYHERDSVERRFGELSGRLRDDGIPLTFVALEQGEPIGTASLTADDMETRPELKPWLASVLVTPTARGRGVGSALVQAVVAKAAELGYRILYLYTEDQMALYARLGWELHERTSYYSHDVTIMRIAL